MESIRLLTTHKKNGGGKTTKKRLHQGTNQTLRKYLAFPSLRKVSALTRRISSLMEKPSNLSFQTNTKLAVKKGGCKGLTVISANLWHDWPMYRHSLDRLEAFARLVEEHRVDILLLQEVSRTASIRTDAWLSQRLGMTSIYSRANGHLNAIGFEEGLAILSRHSLSQPVLHQLSPESNRFTRRLALGSQVDTPCGNLMVFSVHLSINRKHNTCQAKKLQSWVHGMTGKKTVLVGGDFNAGERSHSIKTLRQRWVDTFRHLNPLADGTTHEVCWPWGKPLKRSRLDYIFLKAEQTQWKLMEALHLETRGQRHSDHRAVLLRLTPDYAKISL
jgi:endonuclease/exonuclease/phosphatase family metal-dependent hydrolase